MLDVKELLRDLVSFNTIKDKENKRIIEYLEKTLISLGFKTEIKDRFLIMYNKNDSNIGFLGHTDTVEYTEGWNYGQLKLTKVGERLYGLGVCDMKSGIAAIISAISDINFSNLKKGIKLFFSYDEEIGFAGINEIIKSKTKFPKTMIIGEPTNNEILVGSKGLMEYRIALKGRKVHSSNPEKGESAILKTIKLIDDLNDFYNKKIKIVTNNNFEINYTTMNIGKINGGSAINSVPDSCEFLIDFRTTDINIEKKIIDKLNELKEKYDAIIDKINLISPFLNEFDSYNKTASFITEASFIKNTDRMILGAGPVTAHEVNEYITEDSLNKLVQQYKALIIKYCE